VAGPRRPVTLTHIRCQLGLRAPTSPQPRLTPVKQDPSPRRLLQRHHTCRRSRSMAP